LLAAREFSGDLAALVAQRREAFVIRGDLVAHLAAVAAEGPAAQLQVLLHRHVLEHARLLRDIGEPVADFPVRRDRGDAVPVKQDVALVGFEEPERGLQRGRLADPIGAQNRGDLALARGDVQVRQDVEVAIIADRQILHLQHRAGHFAGSSAPR
jgi:hypothetical protein